MCSYFVKAYYNIVTFCIFFDVLLTVHLSIKLAINQLNAQILFFNNKYIICLYMFRAICAHHQEVKLYYTASGITTPVGGRPVRRLREDSLNPCTGQPPTEFDDTRCCIIQFDLLMMSTYCSKHVEAYNILIIKKKNLCIKLVNC